MALEIRCPIHGFIKPSKWEIDVISHPVFQRLRRIRQLAWTDMVYPGSMHTRFEHSLGVMHTAGRIFEDLRRRLPRQLQDFGITKAGLERDRIIVRLAALLHDVGHAPFSHAGEDLLPVQDGSSNRFKHEHYSAALIRTLMTDVIDSHKENENHGITASKIADLIEGKTVNQREIFWRQLISSQLDADRADYLLRDSHHIGVRYGKYDLERLIISLTVARDPETDGPVLAVEYAGLHSAEALILARYMMFTQVYFHKTRVAFDKHVLETLKTLLADAQAGVSTFPPPTDEVNLNKYLGWTDWRVLGLLEAGKGGEHGNALRARTHQRVLYETREIPSIDELTKIDNLLTALKAEGLYAYVGYSRNSWYKYSADEIRILKGEANPSLVPLSELSTVVKGLSAHNQARIYVWPGDKTKAKGIEAKINKPDREAA